MEIHQRLHPEKWQRTLHRYHLRGMQIEKNEILKLLDMSQSGTGLDQMLPEDSDMS